MQNLFIRKIREGKEQKLREWSKELSERKMEVIKSLEVENVNLEVAHIVEIGEKKYFIAYMYSNEKILPADMDMNINREHVQILKECLEMPQLGEMLYFFNR